MWLPGGCVDSETCQSATVTIGSEQYCAAIATTEQERINGLTALPPLTEGEALWLDYPVEGEACIDPTPQGYDIDVIFISEAGVVVASQCAVGVDSEVFCAFETADVVERLPAAYCEELVGSVVVFEKAEVGSP